MLQVLVAISQSFVVEKRHGAMQKLFIKKKEKRLKKWTSVRDIENNGYYDACQKKEMNKIVHVFLQSIFKFQKRDMLLWSIVELG